MNATQSFKGIQGIANKKINISNKTFIEIDQTSIFELLSSVL